MIRALPLRTVVTAAARRAYGQRQWQMSLLNYEDLLDLDERAFRRGNVLGFHCLYRRGLTLSAEVFKNPSSRDLHFDAIAHFHEWLESSSPVAQHEFLRCAQDLLSRTTPNETHFVLENRAQVRGFAPHAIPWISCHTQAWGVSVFARAFQMTGDKAFLCAAEGLMRSFSVDISRGGVRTVEATGKLFFEKYPFTPKHVLNGFLAALLSIHEYGSKLAPDALDLFDEAVATLSDRVLDTYDTGYTSRYDQLSRPGPPSACYNKVHARQLQALAKITGQRHLARRAERWAAYELRPALRARLAADCLLFRLRGLPRYASYLLS